MRFASAFPSLLLLVAACGPESDDSWQDLGDEVTERSTTFKVNSLVDAPRAPGSPVCKCISTAGGKCTLRAAVQTANVCSGADSIRLDVAGTYGLTLADPLAGAEKGDLDITESVTIYANSETRVGATVDARRIDDRVFDIHPSAEHVELRGFKVANGFPQPSAVEDSMGGCIRVTESSLTLRTMIVGGDPHLTGPSDPHPGEGCVATRGGGVWSADSDLELIGARILGNEALDNGASPGRGAGIYGSMTNLYAEEGEFLFNEADGDGGGLFFLDGGQAVATIEIFGTKFEANVARTGSGGAASLAVAFSIEEAEFLGNSAPTVGGRGGAIDVLLAPTYPNGEDSSIYRTRIADNEAFSGGGIAASDRVRIEQSTIRSNSATLSAEATGRGGGIFLDDGGDADIFGVEIRGNDATLGAGLYSRAQPKIVNTTFAFNNATTNGGGVYVEAGSTLALHTTIRNNGAPAVFGSGGGIYVGDGELQLDRSVIDANTGSECFGNVVNLGAVVSGPNTCLSSFVPSNGGWGVLAPHAPVTFTEQFSICLPNPAISLASPCGVSVDQRGAARSEECDAGAYEQLSPLDPC